MQVCKNVNTAHVGLQGATYRPETHKGIQPCKKHSETHLARKSLPTV